MYISFFLFSNTRRIDYTVLCEDSPVTIFFFLFHSLVIIDRKIKEVGVSSSFEGKFQPRLRSYYFDYFLRIFSRTIIRLANFTTCFIIIIIHHHTKNILKMLIIAVIHTIYHYIYSDICIG